MAKHRIGKAQKINRRNRQKHASRMGGGDSMTGQRDAVSTPKGPLEALKGPFDALSEQALPYLSVLAMRKYKRKEEKRAGKNEES